MPANAIINSRLITGIDDPGVKRKIADKGQTWIRDKLKEVRFSSKIIPLGTATVDQCQVSTAEGDDTLVKIVPIAPKTLAMSVTFRGQPTARLISSRRVAMAFAKVSSELLFKPEIELLAYEKMGIPITKIMEENTVLDIEKVEDRTMIVHLEAGIQALQAAQNGVGAAPALNATILQAPAPPIEWSVFKGELARNAAVDTSVPLPIQVPDIIDLQRMIDGREMTASKILITQPDFDYVAGITIEDLGSVLKGETFKHGYKHPDLIGTPYVRTIKTDVLRPGNVYVFAAHDFVGKFDRLTELKFYIDKDVDVIKWQAWEHVGMVLVNVNGWGKCETYSGDATAHNTDGIVNAVTPRDERDLNAENNRVADGMVYPFVIPH